MSINNYTTNICGICANESADLYQCTSCHSESEKVATNKFICAFCIASHLRCNHEVTNQKGLKPLVCQTHKMLQNEFCRSCDVAICWGCISKHSEHKLSSLDDRALELRPKIFESLIQLEDDEKLLKEAKSKIENTIKNHKKEQEILRETFLSEVENIKLEGLKMIDENRSLMKEPSKALDDVMKLQQKLRMLLSVSSDHLVNQFPSIDNQMKEMRIESVRMKKQQKSVLFSCNTNNIATNLEQLHSCISRGLKSVISDQTWHCWCKGLLFRVCAVGTKLFVEDATIDSSGSVSYTNCRTQVFNEEITHCFSVLGSDFSNPRICILMSNKTAHILYPSSTSITHLSVSYPTKNHFLWPYYTRKEDSTLTPHWCYWEEGLIKFTHEASFTIQCETIPSVRVVQDPWIGIFFILPDNSVILALINNKRYIQFTIPDIQRISYVSCSLSGVLFFFSADGTSFYTSRISHQLKLSEPVKHTWDNQSTVIEVSVEGFEFSLTKAANPSDSQNPYLFKLKMN
ncbi:uncharacterized protein LOC142350003 [Convolutriloba macropyga]|uniref:uncharacterized protein LOC142350003 n=1 Tax=Convolutriloba macropyga TaxID=536237 RepID=UPI003F51BC5C